MTRRKKKPKIAWEEFCAMLAEIANFPPERRPAGFTVVDEGTPRGIIVLDEDAPGGFVFLEEDEAETLGDSTVKNALLEGDRIAGQLAPEWACCNARRRLLARDPGSRLVEFGIEHVSGCSRCAVLVGIAAGIRAERVATGTGTAAQRFRDIWIRKRPRQGRAKVIASAVLDFNPGLKSGNAPWSPFAFNECAKETPDVETSTVSQNANGDWTGTYGYSDTAGKVSDASAGSVHRAARRMVTSGE